MNNAQRNLRLQSAMHVQTVDFRKAKRFRRRLAANQLSESVGWVTSLPSLRRELVAGQIFIDYFCKN